VTPSEPEVVSKGIAILTYIELDRRFFGLKEKFDADFDPDVLAGHDLSDGWEGLLPKRRVVLLAEAGSGKSEEMEEQARHIVAGGGFAFYTTVQDVVRYGLSDAVGQR